MSERPLETSVQVTFTFDVPPTASRMQELVGVADRIGATLTAANCIPRPETTTAAKHISAGQFLLWAENLGHKARGIGLTWNSAIREGLVDTDTYTPNTVVDLEKVLARLRAVEADEDYVNARLPDGLGITGWNIFAGLINERLANDPAAPLLLPWDETIHRYFEFNNSRRLVAQKALAEKYRALRHTNRTDKG
jgi:hypothetical protein